jgi:hypothetical protein
MKVAVDLKAMSVPEKMELLQAVWDDLLQAESELQSPDWHGEVLRERDERVNSGQEKFIDWEDAKAELKRELK